MNLKCVVIQLHFIESTSLDSHFKKKLDPANEMLGFVID